MKLQSIARACAALAAITISQSAFAGEEGWISDFDAAKKQAAESKQSLLMDFTGSDWCGWCIKLRNEVFSKDEFKAGVEDKFVLVELDYPNDSSKMKQETISQNEELKDKYDIQGFPTILLCDASGKPYASTGYAEGGPEKYVKQLDKLRETKAVRDQAFEAAGKAEGVAKAKELAKGLDAMKINDGLLGKFYADEMAAIKAADPQDETGFAKAMAKKQEYAAYQGQLGELAQGGRFDDALALVEKTMKSGGFETEQTQEMIMTKSMVLAETGKFDEALKAADEAKALAPESNMAAGIDDYKKRVEAAKAKGGKEDADEDPAE